MLAGLHDLGSRLVNTGVERIEKMVGKQKMRNSVERFIINEDGAEKRLFSLYVMWRSAEREIVHKGCADV